MMAALNPNITNVMIDGSLFQTEVFERDILAVPSVYLNGEIFSQGRISLTEILNKIDTGAMVRQAEILAEKEPFDVLVVGGGLLVLLLRFMPRVKGYVLVLLLISLVAKLLKQ